MNKQLIEKSQAAGKMNQMSEEGRNNLSGFLEKSHVSYALKSGMDAVSKKGSELIEMANAKKTEVLTEMLEVKTKINQCMAAAGEVPKDKMYAGGDEYTSAYETYGLPTKRYGWDQRDKVTYSEKSGAPLSEDEKAVCCKKTDAMREHNDLTYKMQSLIEDCCAIDKALKIWKSTASYKVEMKLLMALATK